MELNGYYYLKKEANMILKTFKGYKRHLKKCQQKAHGIFM